MLGGHGVGLEMAGNRQERGTGVAGEERLNRGTKINENGGTRGPKDTFYSIYFASSLPL